MHGVIYETKVKWSTSITGLSSHHALLSLDMEHTLPAESLRRPRIRALQFCFTQANFAVNQNGA